MKKTVLTFLITLSLFALAMTATVFAYFSLTDEGFFGVKIELLFDKLSPEYKGQIDGVNFDQSAEWGTQANPYVISDVNHLMNLSSLQNRHYFDNADGTPAVPYFFVSTDMGLPVLIDGKGATIESIGTHSSPFIGTISGVIGDKLHSADGASVTLGTLTASTSCIYNFDVVGNAGEPDVGLFGTVSYYGTEAADGESFTGQASKIANLLLTDMTVKATHPLTDLAKWWQDLFTDLAHKFTFGEDPTATTQTEPHETNHIGILCGHAEYAAFENISIYYTPATDGKSAACSAIDIAADDGKSNFYSSTGIVGLMYNLNPTHDTNGNIIAGSGTSMGDIGHVSGGGGGIGSGVHTGYFFGDELFAQYVPTNADGSFTASSQTLLDATFQPENSTIPKGTKLITSVAMNEGTANAYTGHYFTDANKVFTFALSTKPDADTVTEIWDERPNDIDLSASLNDFTEPHNFSEYNLNLTKTADTSDLSIKTLANLSNNADYMLGVVENNNIKVINGTGTGNPAMSFDFKSTAYDGDGADKKLLSAVLADGLEKETIAYKYSFKKTAVSSDRLQTNITTGKNFGVTTLGKDNYSFYTGDAVTDDTMSWGMYKSQPCYNYDWLFEKASNYSYETTDSSGNTVTNTPFEGATDRYIISVPTFYRTEIIGGILGTFSQTKITLYISYADGNFALTSDKTKAAALYLFAASRSPSDSSLTGLTDANPSVNNKPATDYVLFANSEYRYSQTNESENGNIHNTTNSVNNGNYGYGAEVNGYMKLSYELKSIESLKWAANPLSSNIGDNNRLKTVKEMVSMREAVIDATVSQSKPLIGSNKTIRTSGVVKVPIGTKGTEYHLPSGSIGFEIQKTDTDGYAYVNVIAVVTPGNEYKNSSIGIWTEYLTDLQGWLGTDFGGDTVTNKFDASYPQYAFPLPTSTQLGNDAEKKEYFYKVGYAANEGDTPTDYYARFHTETVLVAHTFKIKANVGDVFLLAATNGPLQLAYFSVSGVAGGGGIGSEGSELGKIDFVYEYGGKIVTVDTYNEGGTDYSTFRYSYVYLYTDLKNADGSFVSDLDNATLNIYRALTDAGPPGMTIAGIGDAKFVKVIRADKYFSDEATYAVDGEDKSENIVTSS